MRPSFVGAPRCPSCGRRQVRRSHRTGPLERALSLFGVYPFRCQLCGRRFRRLRACRRPAVAGDRREFERVPVRVAVTLVRGGERTPGTVVDLSIEGCAIEVAGAFAVDDVVQVALDDGRIATAGAVVRSATPTMIGVQFHGMPAEDRERLRRFLHDRLPAVGAERGVGSASPHRAGAALSLWLAALLLFAAALTLVRFMPRLSLCTWGVDC